LNQTVQQLEQHINRDEPLTVAHVGARAVIVPLSRPIRTAVGTIPSAPLVLIDLRSHEGVIGRSYIFAYTPLALQPIVHLINDLGRELAGKPIAPVSRMRDFDRRFRLVGWQGLIGMAVAGLDMAFWDALARSLNVSLARLLGGEPRSLPAYDSFGVVDPKADATAIAESVDRGFRAIKIKIGDGDLANDVATVAEVRRIIGPQTALMVDYNQSLTPVEARRRISELAEFNIEWVEEPVPAEDIHGHARVRVNSPIPVQTGENWWFPRDMEKAVAAGASDYAMLDVMKIGGVTGWIRAAALAEGASLPVSSHTFVEASAHLLAVTPTTHWLEYLDIASSVLAEQCEPQNGCVTAMGPGLGLNWDEAAITRYAA
jgi:mandelate racemase